MRHYLQVTVPDEKELYIVGDIHGMQDCGI